LLVRELECEPHNREVTPTKFLKEHIFRINNLADVRRMISIYMVIFKFFNIVIIISWFRRKLWFWRCLTAFFFVWGTIVFLFPPLGIFV
jgi:hypothetical protein